MGNAVRHDRIGKRLPISVLRNSLSRPDDATLPQPWLSNLSGNEEQERLRAPAVSITAYGIQHTNDLLPQKVGLTTMSVNQGDDMRTAISKNHIGICLTLALSVLGLFSAEVATAVESSGSEVQKLCSDAELAQMLEQSSPGCSGSFDWFDNSTYTQGELEADANEPVDVGKEQTAASTDGVILFCMFRSNGDFVHLSSSDGALSAHGWWEIVLNYRCPAKSTVTVALQGYWCDSAGCRFIDIAPIVPEYIGPKAVTGQRVTARRACAPTKLVSYRSIIRTTLGGTSRTDKYTTAIRDLYCYPS